MPGLINISTYVFSRKQSSSGGSCGADGAGCILGASPKKSICLRFCGNGACGWKKLFRLGDCDGGGGYGGCGGWGGSWTLLVNKSSLDLLFKFLMFGALAKRLLN